MEGNGEDQLVPVFALAFNPSKEKEDEVVSTQLNGCVRLWSLKEQKILHTHNVKNILRKFRSQWQKDCHDL